MASAMAVPMDWVKHFLLDDNNAFDTTPCAKRPKTLSLSPSSSITDSSYSPLLHTDHSSATTPTSAFLPPSLSSARSCSTASGHPSMPPPPPQQQRPLSPPSPPLDQVGGEDEARRFKGVRQRKWGKFVAEIRDDKGQRIWLGSHDSAEAAARVYDMAARMLRGAAAQLNFPSDANPKPVMLPRTTADALLRAKARAAASLQQCASSAASVPRTVSLRPARFELQQPRSPDLDLPSPPPLVDYRRPSALQTPAATVEDANRAALGGCKRGRAVAVVHQNNDKDSDISKGVCEAEQPSADWQQTLAILNSSDAAQEQQHMAMTCADEMLGAEELLKPCFSSPLPSYVPCEPYSANADGSSSCSGSLLLWSHGELGSVRTTVV